MHSDVKFEPPLNASSKYLASYSYAPTFQILVDLKKSLALRKDVIKARVEQKERSLGKMLSLQRQKVARTRGESLLSPKHNYC